MDKRLGKIQRGAISGIKNQKFSFGVDPGLQMSIYVHIWFFLNQLEHQVKFSGRDENFESQIFNLITSHTFSEHSVKSKVKIWMPAMYKVLHATM